MQSIDKLNKSILKNVKLIVFDVDGVLVPRGTKIKQANNITTLQTKHIDPKQIDQIKKLRNLGFLINISSGRGLYMLQEIFRGILPFASLTYENGSATWIGGKIVQHINSFKYLSDLFLELKGIETEKNVKGFEPKEFIMTIHCKDRVKKIEDTISKYKDLYHIWNGEAYDIGVKNIQNKAVGLTALRNYLNLEKGNVLAIGDNLNDKEMIDAAGISVSADKTRIEGDFFVPLEGAFLPADLMMQQIIKELS